MKNYFGKIASTITPLILFIFFISIAIIISGYIYLNKETEELRTRKYNELEAIAEIKVNQLLNWKNERISEVNFFSNNSNYNNNIRDLITGVNVQESRELLREGLTHIKNNHAYENIFIAGTNEELHFSLDEDFTRIDTSTFKFIEQAVLTDSIVFTDFYMCGINNTAHLDIISPVKNKAGISTAAIVFRIDPESYLYPLIQSWPLPSKTAETYLVRKEGNDVLFLNELRHLENTAMKFKIPLSRKDISAVVALEGYKGIWEGYDYRGEEVLSYITPVENTNWIMLAEIDKDELLAELQTRNIYTLALILFLILLVILVLILIYNYKQRGIYTEKLKQQKQIEEQQRQLKTLISNLSGFVYRSKNDENWTMEFISDGVEDLTGYPATDFIDNKIRSYDSIIHKDDKEKVWNEIQSMVYKKTPFTLEYRIITKENKIKWVWERGRAVFLNEKAVALEGFITDITERKTAEEAVKLSEKKYKDMLNGMSDTVWVIDFDANIIDVNTASMERLGYTREEFLSMPISEIDNNLKPGQIKNLAASMPKDKIQIFETEHTTKDGRKIPVEVNSTLITYDKKAAILSIARDITERKQAEEALRESEEKYRTLIEVSQDAIYLVFEHKIIYVNPAALKLFGAGKPEQILNKSPLELIHPDFHNIVKDRVKIMVEQDKAAPLNEEKIMRLDGLVRDVEVSASSIPFRGSKAFQVVLRDITERKEAQLELKKLKDNLEIEVQQKTKELQERIKELERFHDATIDRELRMKELRDEIKRLKK